MKALTLRDVSTTAMVAGNEKRFHTIIHDGMVKEWVGFGWITERTATADDLRSLPSVMGEKPFEQWLLDALREYEEWFRKASPSAEYQPRVFASFGGGKAVARRPFKLRGHWSVRCCGVARLVNPHRNEYGQIVFDTDYSRAPDA
jgi:hypothetical protein